jgi:hypothetical protein
VFPSGLQNVWALQVNFEMSSSTKTARRLKDIFPGGFDSKFGNSTSISQNGTHFSLKPEQLHNSLVERYDPKTPTESIIVKSAWYGKQTKSAQHEFIVVEFEDIRIPGLKNFLVLDRNAENYHQGSTRTAASSQTVPAHDSFRVSYEGNVKKLLQECQLMPYKFLESLSFPSDEPLHLYELVALAEVASKRYPNYHVVDSSCYLFAGVVWECMQLMRPKANYQEALARKRGKCHWFRYTPTSLVKHETHTDFQARLTEVEKELEEHRDVSVLSSWISGTR